MYTNLSAGAGSALPGSRVRPASPPKTTSTAHQDAAPNAPACRPHFEAPRLSRRKVSSFASLCFVGAASNISRASPVVRSSVRKVASGRDDLAGGRAAAHASAVPAVSRSRFCMRVDSSWSLFTCISHSRSSSSCSCSARMQPAGVSGLDKQVVAQVRSVACQRHAERSECSCVQRRSRATAIVARRGRAARHGARTCRGCDAQERGLEWAGTRERARVHRRHARATRCGAAGATSRSATAESPASKAACDAILS